ncbi:Retroelement pol polyprotein, partial [Globisporangium splendens]
MLGGTLRQGAVQWFIVKKTEIETVDQFFLELGNEFIPADLQERLRDQLEMSELDKIMYFVRGLAPAIRTERWTMTVRIVALRMDVGPTQNLVRWKWTMSESWVVKSVCVSAFASIAIDLDIEHQSVRPTQRARRSSPMVEHNLAAVDEVDYPIVFDNAELNAVGIARKSNLFVVNGRVDGNDVRILIDSGASTNLIQRGLVKKVLNTAVIEAQGFDGRRTKKQVNEVEASCQVQDKKFEAMQFTEWDLPNSHDVIFGQPWFVEHNPIIDWRKQTFALPEDTSVHERSGSEICSKIKNAEYEELFVVKVSAVNDISPVVPPELKPVIDRFADCFPELLPDGLLPERAVNFELQPKPDAVPSSRPPFRLSKTEQGALEEFVRDNVKKGWIEISNSPWISNIFGVPKKDPATGMAVKRAEWLRNGNAKVPIRWVIDYRYVNSQTKIPKIPLPHIEELFDQMLGATVFTVIDLAQGYHQMRVKPDSRPYTAFRSQKETYQWCVAPMGLAGMPGVWSRLMRVLFGKFKFVVVYLDDICIFSRSMKDHAQHLAMVCEVLRHEKLYARLSKCEFGKSSVHFLGHTVTAEGIQVDAKKTTAIEKYPTPTTQKTLLSFLGLAGYYRRFICDFARIALPLHRLTKKDAKWTWSSEHDHAFRALKLALQQAPTLRLPDLDRRFTVTTDASGYCMGGVLSQKIDGFDAPIAFYSKKFGHCIFPPSTQVFVPPSKSGDRFLWHTSVCGHVLRTVWNSALLQYEEKWPAHEKELLAIKFTLSKWRHYLHGRQFDVFTDNSACRWMLHHPKVTPKLARMLTFFSQFDFVLHHVKGSTNVVADALSRPGPEEVKQSDELPIVSTPEVHACDDACHARSQSISRHVVSAAFLRHLPDSDCSVFLSAVDFRGERRAVAVRQEQVHTVDTQWTSVHLSEATKKAFQAGYSRDPSFAEVWQSREGNGKFEKRNGLLFLRTKHPVLRLCVPNSSKLVTDVIQEFHDAPVAAHPGVRRTQLKAAQWHYWPALEKDIHEYVGSCQTCARWKSNNRKKIGLMMPIPTLQECWDVVTGHFRVTQHGSFWLCGTTQIRLHVMAGYTPLHLPSVKPLFARALEEEVVTEEFLVVDNDGSSLEDEGALTMKLGSVDEWVEYEELQSERHAAYLHELEGDPSADVSMYRTKEENDAVEAVNNRKRKHEVLITNEEAGVRAIVHDELKYSLPEMPPPGLWPAGKTASNLLARARLCARDYDAQFKNWREKRLRDENGELRIHPIPVVLFVGETEEECDADFMSCINKIKGGSTRTVSTDPTAQRSQCMQFAVDRVRLFRSKQGGGTPLQAGGRAGIRRQITRANDSPSVAPQRRQQDPGCLREDAQQAPTSSATHRTHATSQGSGCSPYAAAHAAGAQHGSGAVPACQSAGQVAPYFASASVVAPDAVVEMVHANASSLGALQQAVRTLRQQYLDETSLLKQRVTALETELKEARQMLEEYHVRGKHFHARYAPRVKTLWERHNALVSRWAASEPPDETDVLPDWDKNPQ